MQKVEFFVTHKKEIKSGKELEDALRHIASDYRDNARNLRIEDPYASHVTEAEKDRILSDSLNLANQIERGEGLNNFTVWQKVNHFFTGECVAFLQK
jgi:hypothetical protein